MNTGIHLAAVLIANLMGLTMLITTMVGNSWRIKVRNSENRILTTIVIISIVACIADPICFLADGKPGTLCFLLVFVANTTLYLANLMLMPVWLFFLSNYLGVQYGKLHRTIIFCSLTLGAMLLIVNIFTPIVFSVSEDNVYSRSTLFWYYMVSQGIWLIDGLAMYFLAKKKSGKLKLFPVWAFAIPVVIGMTIQSIFYGVSTIWPFVAISVSCLFACLQNEILFRDKLTGLFNRFYLDVIKENIKPGEESYLTAMMMDLNAFKVINDTFGHAMGDEALIETARQIRNAVGTVGEVIRYAGDEFIILLNTQKDEEIENVIHRVNRNLQEFNEKANKPYKLSVSIGYCKMDLNEYTMDALLDLTDKYMYEEKKKFYKNNPEINRRHD